MTTMGKPKKIVDSLLVISYRSGNKKAMDLLVRRWNNKLCAHAYGYVKDWALAKDITQDTWGAVLKKIHRLRDTNSFGSWAMTITTRKALDTLTNQKKSRTLYENELGAALTFSQEVEDTKEAKIRKINKAMTALTFDQRMVLKLFYLEEYSLNEISAITSASVNTVKTRLFRAREKIKNELKIKNYEE